MARRLARPQAHPGQFDALACPKDRRAPLAAARCASRAPAQPLRGGALPVAWGGGSHYRHDAAPRPRWPPGLQALSATAARAGHDRRTAAPSEFETGHHPTVAYHPNFATVASLKALFFNGLKNYLRFVDHMEA